MSQLILKEGICISCAWHYFCFSVVFHLLACNEIDDKMRECFRSMEKEYLQLFEEGGTKPRGKKKMESSGNCKHFMLADAECKMDTVRKEDREIGRSQIMKTCKLCCRVWTVSPAF